MQRHKDKYCLGVKQSNNETKEYKEYGDIYIYIQNSDRAARNL